jgi:hypothetical protein
MTKNNLDIVVFPVLSPKKRECSFLSLEFNNLGILKYQNTSPYFNHGETNATMQDTEQNPVSLSTYKQMSVLKGNFQIIQGWRVKPNECLARRGF